MGTIRDWPASERPREKLLAHGPHALSDAELLAIFLRTGVSGKTAVDLARELLQTYGGLRALLEADRERFCAMHGLGIAKYAQLQAVLEMARRHLAETPAGGARMRTTWLPALVALSITGVVVGTIASAQPPERSGQLAQGKQVYDYWCLPCHGPGLR